MQVEDFLEQIGLGHLAPAFKENAVTGDDLATLTDEDFSESLHCTNLQIKKIRKNLSEYGIAHSEANEATPSMAIPKVGAPLPQTPLPVGTDTNDDGSKELQKSISELETRSAQAQQSAGTYAQAANLLKQADAELKQALQSLGTTSAMGAMNIIHDVARPGLRRPGVGIGRGRRDIPGSNMIEMATVTKANKSCQRAGQFVQQAMQVLPTIPNITAANIQSATGGVMFGVFARGFGGDMVQMATVNKGKQATQQMQSEVATALDWIVRNQHAFEMEAAQLKATIITKQAELSAAHK